jgi:DNA-binding LytR/AlgR family response regulator
MFGFYRIASVCPTLKVADTEYNTDEIIRCGLLAKNEGAAVVVFPELCITGYSCADLFGQQRLLEAAEKARQWFALVEGAEAAEAAAGGNSGQQDSIFVKSEGQLRKVAFTDIKYVEGMKDYVLLHLCSEKRPLVTHITMKAVEELLPAGSFMRVHRSYIVALDKIDSVSGTNDISIGDTFIHVSDAYRANFEEYLSQRMLR